MAHGSLLPVGNSLSSDPFLSFQRGMNRLFDEMLRGSDMPTLTGQSDDGSMIMPRRNVSETDAEVRITADLPGVAEKDVDVTLDDDILTIRGEKKLEKKEDKENYHFVERSFGQFQRSLRVPHSVNPEQVQAHVANGVLTVILPKNPAQEKTRHIQVKGASH